MSVSDAVPRSFKNDFELVATYYGIRSSGEYEQAKQAARNDLQNAITTFAAIAAEIQGEK